jgi:hypothetical protein
MFKKIKKLLKKKVVKKTPKKVVKKVVKKVKPTKKKVVLKKKKATTKVSRLKSAKPIGRVTHYYTNIKVAIVKFSNPPKIGSMVRFEGNTTSFIQPLVSAQFDHKPVSKIPKGSEVGIKVKARVREDDSVYIVK